MATTTIAAAPRKIAASVSTGGVLIKGKHNPVDATGAARAMTLPTGANEGAVLSVEKTDSSANTVTITGSIRGVAATTVTLFWQNESVELTADATGSWWPTAGYKTKTALDGAYLSAAAAASKFTPRRGFRTIVIGDSIDAQPQSWFVYYSLNCKRMDVLRNAGIGGQNTAQMLARFDTDVTAYSPDVVILGGSTNDRGQGIVPSLTRSNIDAMVQKTYAMGATPILRTSPPSDVVGANAFSTIPLHRQGILDHNAWLLAYAAKRGIDVLDIHQAVVNPATGGYLAGVSSDGTHPVESGYKAIADYLLAQPLPTALRGQFPFPRTVVDASNILLDGVFVGDTTPADGVADSGWYTSGTGTPSLTAAATGISGNWQRITTASATAFSIMQDVSSGYSAGDVLQLVGRLRTSGTSVALVRWSIFGASGNQDVVPSLAYAVDGVFSARLTVPAGTTALRVMLQIYNAAGWAEMAEVALRNLTTLGGV